MELEPVSLPCGGREPGWDAHERHWALFVCGLCCVCVVARVQHSSALSLSAPVAQRPQTPDLQCVIHPRL